ncbi:PIG-L deacetylase family protein [Catellatospora vulcania]|uniref:PIG-L deacetylase family protein n=1 Tax=Catellatospora vulcania TaxID=1460450 RepID=UPI0018AF6B85|nr:PIG-L family deacetylase [Catellatospora vulcania]
MRRRTLLSAAALGVAAAAYPAARAVAATAPALFVAAHPDDETLAMSTAIAEHVAAGQDVHVLLLTDGEGSGTINVINGTTTSPWWGNRHVPTAEGYAPLTATTLAAARVIEAQTALRCLAAGLPGTLTVHRASLPDGAVTSATAQAAIVAVADQIAPGGVVRLKGHSPTVDNHADHLAAGQAMVALATSNPARFSDRRHYILPMYWTDSRLSLVTESWDGPTDAGIAARVRAAVRSYGAWSPAQGSYAIGYHSVATMLDQLMSTPKCLQHP